jgi:hypothetical protein
MGIRSEIITTSSTRGIYLVQRCLGGGLSMKQGYRLPESEAFPLEALAKMSWSNFRRRRVSSTSVFFFARQMETVQVEMWSRSSFRCCSFCTRRTFVALSFMQLEDTLVINAMAASVFDNSRVKRLIRWQQARNFLTYLWIRITAWGYEQP